MSKEEEFSDLMSNVMNIQCRLKDEDFSDPAERLTYKAGHRDARHDAVELIAEVASRCRAQGGNTSDNSTQAAANKAAEERELPELPEPIRMSSDQAYLGFSADHMREYARQAIAADRAARQVANKAEVDLTDDQIYDFWLYRDCMPAIQAGDMKAQFVSAVRSLLVTAPATTGANIVLTDEQIAAGGRWLCDQSSDACGVNRDDNWKIYGNEYTEEFRGAALAAFGAAPVAAQAGQVAVPEKKHE